MVRKLLYIAISVMLASIVILISKPLPAAAAAGLPRHVKAVEHLELPDLTFETLEGEQVSLKDDQKVTILHFWASWCTPCIAELPALDAFARQDKENIQFMVVSLDSPAGHEKAQSFYQKYHITHLPLLFGKQKELIEAVSLIGLPTTLFIIDDEIVGRADADLPWDKSVADYVESLLVE